MNLSIEALEWSLLHHRRYGDTDLFPRAFEFEVIEARWPEYRKMLADLDLATYTWRAGRSMLFMKDQVSFRRATQFEPVDSILFGALIWTVAPQIEARRAARTQNAVFSYRFEASSTGQLFAPGKAKQAFWTHTADACKDEKSWLLTTDIADFYNQIRHSSIKSELDATVSKKHSAVFMKALSAVQKNKEVGVPVGPHSAHLLAELVLAPFDEHMLQHNDLRFLRFVDDIHVACKSENDAREVLYEIADYMHRHLQLSLSRHKTQVLNGEQMRAYARTALGPTEGTSDEAPRTKIEVLVEDHTSAGDDEEVDISGLDEESQQSLSSDNVRETLDELLDSDTQIKLRKYLRGLMHLRAPGAVEWVADHLYEILPVLPQAIEYLHNVLPRYGGNKKSIFEVLVKALQQPIVARSEHMQTLLLAMCVQFPNLVDFQVIKKMSGKLLPAAQRELVLLAGKLKHRAWIKDFSAVTSTADPWLLRAIVEAAKCLNEDERLPLKVLAEKVLGPTWLLEDSTLPIGSSLHDSHLAPEVVREASKLDVTLTLSGRSSSGSPPDFYGGTLKDTDGINFRLEGVDLPRLLNDARTGKLDGNGRVPDVVQIMLSDGQCLFEKLPDVIVASQAMTDADNNKLKEVLKSTDILIVTSAEIEKRAVLARFTPLKGEEKILVGTSKGVTFRCGQFGRYSAAHVHTTQGPDGRHGATLTTMLALSGTKFKACFVIGIAFGFDRKNQRLGDVLVAEQVQPYEHAKVEGDAEQFSSRGAPIQCGLELSNGFRSRMDDWEKHRTLTRVKLHQGVVLSGAKLVNSKPFRDRLLEQFNSLKPVGGEMEGHATYAAAQVGKVEIILVKAICDWADGDKDDSAQLFAMEMAVDACQHLLSKPDILSELKAKDRGLPTHTSNELPDVSKVLAEPKKAQASFENDYEVPFDIFD
ncbi:reverse transcriptase domain-containing protein [Curvibacter lanceolatus]|uniref:reverse transcriptase domain-containing protein n=1 Tax=Curvibacter lanceolatus TaxID=86182 RepID=UPI0003686FC9|nr:reverse transcriptase domain-containing protein [Curvibacter lanceolatus]